MNTNIKYKNSVFSFLFSNPDVLKELYCALEGITLPDDVSVTINTLNDVLFMDRVNDISFEISGRLVVLIEHQSTINPNMAIRLHSSVKKSLLWRTLFFEERSKKWKQCRENRIVVKIIFFQY